jgi:alpha-L-rhamnosidase
MLGHIMEWFYHDLAGLGIDPEEAGYKKIVIDPQPVGNVTWARVRFDSVRGLIASEWKIEAGDFTLSLTIPPNATAIINVPAKDAATVMENGQPASQSPGVRFLRYEKGRAVYEAGSGRYVFRAPWN